MSEKEITVSELVLGERKFLHDMSNKLLVVQGMSTTVLRRLKAEETVDQKELDKLQKVVNASMSMVEMLKTRRSILHQVEIKDEDLS